MASTPFTMLLNIRIWKNFKRDGRTSKEYNVSHLKAFISAMVTYITAELTVGDALKLISSPK